MNKDTVKIMFYMKSVMETAPPNLDSHKKGEDEWMNALLHLVNWGWQVSVKFETTFFL